MFPIILPKKLIPIKQIKNITKTGSYTGNDSPDYCSARLTTDVFEKQTNENTRAKIEKIKNDADLCQSGQANNLFDEYCSKNPDIELKRGQILDGGEIYTSSYTEFFRDDIDWNKFSSYLSKRFKDCERVNTYDYACSEGLEAYSMSIMFQHKFGEDAEKFFPIIAKDIDKDTITKNIERQKTGKMPRKCTIGSMAKAINMCPHDMEKHFVTAEMTISHGAIKKTDALKEKVTNKVIFDEANILEDIENIDSKHPSIIMMRNMWPYVDENEYQDFADKLYHQLAPGSIAVVGSFDSFYGKLYDDCPSIAKALTHAGFKQSKVMINNKYKLIFEKN